MDKTFVAGSSLLALVMCVLLITICTYNIHTSDNIEKAIANGTPALEAQCALDNSLADFCVILATKVGEK